MEDRIKKFDTPEKCEIFAKNCKARERPDLVLLARKRAVEIKADAYRG